MATTEEELKGKITEVKEKALELVSELDAASKEKGFNKSALKRARKLTLELEKISKEYRKVSV